MLANLEKERITKGKITLLLEELFSYRGPHPDFMIIRVENDKVTLELLEFKRLKSKKEEILKREIGYAIVQLVVFYSILKGFLKVDKIDNYKLLIIIPRCPSEIYTEASNIVSKLKESKDERKKYVEVHLTNLQKKMSIAPLILQEAINYVGVGYCKLSDCHNQ